MRDRDYFNPYMSDARWQIYVNGWSPEVQNIRETQFTLGNGYAGSRGVLEEHPKGAQPGTYIAALFDRLMAQVPEMVNAPNPFDLRISVDGEKLDVTAMDVLDHRRILDMRRAFLTRRTVYSSALKQRFSYQSLRFLSLPNKHLAVMRVYLTPLDGPVSFAIVSAVNTAVVNKGIVSEGDKKAFHIYEVDKLGDVDYLCVKTLEKETLIAYASLMQVEHRNRTYFEPHRTFEMSVKKGETLCLTKYISVYTSQDVPAKRVKRAVVENAAKSAHKEFEALVQEHIKAWAIRWKQADISITGDADTERALRFNIYHLLIAGNEDNPDAGIGAKTLSGEGYRGHSFWDTEIFTLPYFTFNFPAVARNLLIYRHQRLPAARENAKTRGFEGAMFPWESADTGAEVTPEWHKDLDGTIKKITTGLQEHHITADVAYALFQYFIATGDEDFMLRHGLEMLFETARFWTSRVSWNKKRGCYEIKNIIGPDEFHENINNNAYTNGMAAWNLDIACKMYRVFRAKKPLAVRRIGEIIGLKTGEPEEWRRIGASISLKRKGGIIEAFDGFHKLNNLPLPEVDDYFIPGLPAMPARELATTQFVKQADVIMLLYLLESMFPAAEIKANYYFYERRTLHKSSLSPSIHALTAARQNDITHARRYLHASLMTDLKNIYGNTEDGIHAACLGGTWQAVIMGFGGLRLHKGELHFIPHLPPEWKEMTFCIRYHGSPLCIRITPAAIKLRWEKQRKGEKLMVRVKGGLHALRPNRWTIITLEPQGTHSRKHGSLKKGKG
ncbi:glycoside hydrolase family 65 protein [candidate division FCPU426 bacterium]|nr:glycoside hydrolase family 65 protein [candidate division FCPU426 bacterium]